MPETVALVPLRTPGTGKTRLRPRAADAPGLDRDERAALAGAMLADVVAALSSSPIARIVVAASGEGAAAAAAALGCEVMTDPMDAGGLNDALAAATSRLRTVEELLIVAADLPVLSAADVAAVLEADAEVVIAPTSGGGTGGLLRRPPDAITTRYGPGSAAIHEAAAHRAQRTVRVAHRPGFRCDVDTWQDLCRLPSRAPEVGPATVAFLDTLSERLTRAG